MNRPICGRFMRLGGYFTNDHLDSWEDSWRCSQAHPSTDKKEG